MSFSPKRRELFSKIEPWLYLSPFLIFIIIFTLYPVINVFTISFKSVSITEYKPDKAFVIIIKLLFSIGVIFVANAFVFKNNLSVITSSSVFNTSTILS